MALALGGGGARGLAHIGVLRAFQHAKIPIRLVVGSSIGAIVGGAFAQTGDAEIVWERFRRFAKSDEYHDTGLDRFRKKTDDENFFGQIATSLKERVVINVAQSRASLARVERLQTVLDAVLQDGTLDELALPFAAVATDLLNGTEVIIKEGDIKEAIRASASIPGFLPPQESAGTLLVDGAVISPIPVRAARRMGARTVIAVDVHPDLEGEPELDNVVDIVYRATNITSTQYTLLLQQEADFAVRPNVGRFHWSEFKEVDVLVREGERAAEENLGRIKRKIWRRRLFSL